MHRRTALLLCCPALLALPLLARATDDVPAGPLLLVDDNAAWSWYQDERIISDPAAHSLLIGSIANASGAGGSPRAGNVDLNTLDLPSRSPALPPPPGPAQPLLSIFQLGTTDPSEGYTDDRASTDIIAVGAASSFVSAGSFSRTVLYFGIAVAGPWRAISERRIARAVIALKPIGEGVRRRRTAWPAELHGGARRLRHGAGRRSARA